MMITHCCYRCIRLSQKRRQGMGLGCSPCGLETGFWFSKCCFQSSCVSGWWSKLDELLSILFQSKNNRPLRTSQIYAQDENATHTQLYTSHFELMKMTAGKRSPPIKPLYVPWALTVLLGLCQLKGCWLRLAPDWLLLFHNCPPVSVAGLAWIPFRRTPNMPLCWQKGTSMNLTHFLPLKWVCVVTLSSVEYWTIV